MAKAIIVMPIANEERTIGKVLDELLALEYEDLFIFPIMDCYSKDNTMFIVKDYEAKTNGRVRLVYYEELTGVVSCYLHGFKKALENKADFIIEMDGGGSHLPSEIPQFIDGLKDGYDCIFGSRFITDGEVIDDPFYRKILSRGGTYLANLVLGTKYKDMTSGFEAFRRDVLQDFQFDLFYLRGTYIRQK